MSKSIKAKHIKFDAEYFLRNYAQILFLNKPNTSI